MPRIRGKLVLDPRPNIMRTDRLPLRSWVDVDGSLHFCLE